MAQYKRKLKAGERWWFKFDYQGTTYFSKTIYLSKFEARKAENALYDEVTTNARMPSLMPILSLSEAINERLEEVQTKKSFDYYKDNKRYYSILLSSLGDVAIDQIKRVDIENILLAVSQKQKIKGGDNYVVNTMLAIYKALFNHAIQRRDLNIKNPCFGIKPFSVSKKLKYIPSDNDIEAVKNFCDDGQKSLIDFVMQTGCRINESLRILVSDVYEDYIVLQTRKSKNSDLIPRKVPKPECLKIAGLKSDDRIFSRWSDTPKFLEHKVKELNQKSWSWHNLRHRYASMLSKNNTPLFQIMILLGHSNLKTTQGYLQLLP